MIVKTSFKLICFILFGALAYSQETDKREENFSTRRFWGVSLVPLFIKKGHIDGDVNKYSLSSSPQLGGEVLVNYYYNFEKNYALVLSAGGELLVHNFNYEIPKNLFDSMGGTSVTFNPVGPIKMSSGYLKIQAELQARLHSNQKQSWFGALGLSALYPIQGGDEYSAGILWGSNSQSVQEYVLIQYQNYQHKPSLSFHITGGHEWVLHSGNLLQAALKLNYSPANVATATYVFTVGHQSQVNGRYVISSSCIGLSVSYIFAKLKRH
jgi:hypothetical protein